MKDILFVTSDDLLARTVRWVLEDAGFSVDHSRSLEAPFLTVGRADPFAVVVDADSIPREDWSTRDILAWFHRRSPVVLLGSGETNDLENDLRAECDYCLPGPFNRERLVSCLNALHRY